MNQKGIVLSGLIYALLSFFLLLLVSLLAVQWYRQNTITSLRDEADAIYDDIYISEYSKDFDYTGDYQTYVVPEDGNYKVQLWGASGGINNVHLETVGSGGYTLGNVFLVKNTLLYIYVGGCGSGCGTSWNGGGSAETSGGGATDVRLNNGLWNNLASLRSRIMVAAGGGGGVYKLCGSYLGNSPGNGGGLLGQSANYNSCSFGYGYSGYGATQTAGGAGGMPGVINGQPGGFGYGGTQSHSSGGGSGYYGGGGGTHPGGTWTGGGGGSSFISGHIGCNAIDASGVHTSQANHYSGKVFNNTVIIDGGGYNWTNVKESQIYMPKPDGTSNAIGVGNIGNGYAKITYIP